MAGRWPATSQVVCLVDSAREPKEVTRERAPIGRGYFTQTPLESAICDLTHFWPAQFGAESGEPDPSHLAGLTWPSCGRNWRESCT